MRIFVAAATGAVGRAMTPQLLSAGHDVTAITRDASKAAALERQGVHAVACDVFDTDALIEAVRHAAPEAVIHQLTDLPAAMDPRNIDDLYARNDRVRREGTRNLLDAASLASVPRFVLQSMGTWYRPEGASVKAERDPLWTDAPEPIGAAVRTVADMETRVTQGVADAVVPSLWRFLRARHLVRARQRDRADDAPPAASAAKMKASTRWRPRYSSWRTGFHSGEISPPQWRLIPHPPVRIPCIFSGFWISRPGQETCRDLNCGGSPKCGLVLFPCLSRLRCRPRAWSAPTSPPICWACCI
jgi:hypothetical protein